MAQFAIESGINFSIKARGEQTQVCRVFAKLCTIRHMRVPFWPMRRAGSWEYFAGSWRETIPYL